MRLFKESEPMRQIILTMLLMLAVVFCGLTPQAWADEGPVVRQSERVRLACPPRCFTHMCVVRCRAPCMSTHACVALDSHRGPYRPSALSASFTYAGWFYWR